MHDNIQTGMTTRRSGLLNARVVLLEGITSHTLALLYLGNEPNSHLLIGLCFFPEGMKSTIEYDRWKNDPIKMITFT